VASKEINAVSNLIKRLNSLRAKENTVDVAIDRWICKFKVWDIEGEYWFSINRANTVRELAETDFYGPYETLDKAEQEMHIAVEIARSVNRVVIIEEA
jgi:hypothetical protein